VVWSRAERGEKGVLGPKKHAPPQSPPRRAPTGRGPGSSGSGSAPGAVCRFSGRGLTVSCAPPRCCSSACAWPQNGKTALIWAVDKGHTAIVEALIKAGANLDLQNSVSDSRTSPPPFCLKIKDFFMIPWTLARAVGGYLVARNLGPKWPKKCPKIKPCRLFGSAVPLPLS